MKPLTITLCGYDKVNIAGGPAVWLTRFPAALRELGLNVRVLLLTWDVPQEGIVYQSLREQRFDVSSHRFSDTHSNIRYLVNDLANAPPDVFVANLVTPAFFAGRWVRPSGIPTVGVLHSDDSFYRAIQNEFICGTPEYAMSAVVCVSKELMHQVEKKCPSDTIPVRIPYGVPTPKITAHRYPGKLRIGFVGRLAEEQKQISEVTRAFCRVTRELEGVEAIIYGDGPDKHRVEQILSAEGAPVRVKLAGPVPSNQMQARLVQECDTVVLLSDYEGLPIALLEAMACGLVPVCLNIRSGIPELIENGVSGLLVDDRRDSFVNAIRLLRDDLELWNRLSHVARKRTREKYSLNVTAKKWVGLFEQLHDGVTAEIPISLPERLNLPVVNPELLAQDRRIRNVTRVEEKPSFGKRVRRFLNV